MMAKTRWTITRNPHLPAPRIVKCTACRELFAKEDEEHGFPRWGDGQTIRLINNPAVWGPDHSRYSLLGFSKGETQNKAMGDAKRGQLPLEAVPFKGMRKRLGWLLEALRLRQSPVDVDRLFTDQELEIRSSSLIRCSISAQTAPNKYSYKLADILGADERSGGVVREVLNRCVRLHAAPAATTGQSFIMLGLEDDLVRWSRAAFDRHTGPVTSIKETTYRSAKSSWAHVAHPSGNQTDPQYQRWCRGEARKPKVLWAREEIEHRAHASDG